MSARDEQERRVPPVLIVLAWLWVGVPFAYGLWQLLLKLPALFGS
ncbi:MULTISPECIES: hypothetical protein [unclassified Pseudonocardia]|nr:MULTISPECIES: hypothetical protein [unclassified Pseudonocardia]